MAVMLGLHFFIPLSQLLHGSWRLLGLLPLAAGLACTAASAFLFKVMDTGVVPFSETTTIVTGGMFRYTRNPMYLGMVLVLIGVALLCGSISPWLVIPVFILIIHTVFILNEEKVLEEKFGEEYLRYKHSVRRWL